MKGRKVLMGKYYYERGVENSTTKRQQENERKESATMKGLWKILRTVKKKCGEVVLIKPR